MCFHIPAHKNVQYPGAQVALTPLDFNSGGSLAHERYLDGSHDAEYEAWISSIEAAHSYDLEV